MLTYPLSAFRDGRMILSEEELLDKLDAMDRAGKSCEVSAYGFSTWENMEPVSESFMKDKVVLTGLRSTLESIAKQKESEGWEAILLYDGKAHYLFVMQEYGDLSEIGTLPESVELVESTRRITYPGYTNLRTGRKSELLPKVEVTT